MLAHPIVFVCFPTALFLPQSTALSLFRSLCFFLCVCMACVWVRVCACSWYAGLCSALRVSLGGVGNQGRITRKKILFCSALWLSLVAREGGLPTTA